MNQKGFANVVLVVLVIILAGVLGYVTLVKKSPEVDSTPQQTTKNTAIPKLQLNYPDVKDFLPLKAILNKELKLDLEGDGINEVAFAYATALNQENNYFSTGVMILKYSDSDGWKVVFEDTDRVSNGGGAKSAFNIEKVSGLNNKEAILVVLTEAGAGTATRWHLIAFGEAFGNSEISKLDPSSIKQSILTERGYQDWGYNGVKLVGSYIVETQPGYSKDTARCCPDKPSIEIKYKFTDNFIVFDSVKELEFKPQG